MYEKSDFKDKILQHIVTRKCPLLGELKKTFYLVYKILIKSSFYEKSEKFGLNIL